MPLAVSVAKLFEFAGLHPCGPVEWKQKNVDENRPGIYVVALVAEAHELCENVDVEYLDVAIAKRWLKSQPVVYIGRTKRSLKLRIGEFYRHLWGNKRPHRGGQDILL